MRPRPQEVGTQHQLPLSQEVGESVLPVLEREPGRLHVGAARVGDDRVCVGTGEQDTGLLECLSHGRDDEPTSRVGVAPEALAPLLRRRTDPGVDFLVGFVHLAAREHVHAGGEIHRALAAEQVGLEALGTVPHQHDGRRIDRDRRRDGPIDVLAQRFGHRDAHQSTSTTISTSTGAVERKGGHADRAASVDAVVAEGRGQELARPVGDAGLAGEVGGGRDEHDGLDDPTDLRQVADLRLDRRDRVERALLGALGGLVDRDLTADLAGGHQLAVAHRHLAGGEDERAAAHRRHVGGDRRHDRRHAVTELGQTLLR